MSRSSLPTWARSFARRDPRRLYPRPSTAWRRRVSTWWPSTASGLWTTYLATRCTTGRSNTTWPCFAGTACPCVANYSIRCWRTASSSRTFAIPWISFRKLFSATARSLPVAFSAKTRPARRACSNLPGLTSPNTRRRKSTLPCNCAPRSSRC